MRTNSSLLGAEPVAAAPVRARHAANAAEVGPANVPSLDLESDRAYTTGTGDTSTFSIRSFDVVRTFVEALTAKNAAPAPEHEVSVSRWIDWDAIEASVADSASLEHAIGRAVVMADQMSRDPLSINPCAPLSNGRNDASDEDVVVAPVALTSPGELASPTAAGEPASPTAAGEPADPFFAFNVTDVVPDFGDTSRYRARVVRRMSKMFGPTTE